MSTTYEYQKLRDGKDEIRLLRVHPASGFDDPIVCSLQIVRLSERPEFGALSYTWGPPVFDQSSSLDGCVKQITEVGVVYILIFTFL